MLYQENHDLMSRHGAQFINRTQFFVGIRQLLCDLAEVYANPSVFNPPALPRGTRTSRSEGVGVSMGFSCYKEGVPIRSVRHNTDLAQQQRT